MSTFKTLKYCVKSRTKFEDFVKNKKIENLVIFIRCENENVYDIRLYYFQNNKTRYVSSSFFENHSLKTVLKYEGFSLIGKKYNQFNTNGYFEKNLFEVTFHGKNKIVDLKSNIKKIQKTCFNLKKKMGRPKLNQGTNKKKKEKSTRRKIIDIIKDINIPKPSRKRKRDHSIKKTTKRLKGMYNILQEHQKIKFLMFGINTLKSRDLFINTL